MRCLDCRQTIVLLRRLGLPMLAPQPFVPFHPSLKHRKAVDMNDQTQERAVEAAELEEHIGPEEHGPPLSEESVEALRKISSAVWGGWPASVTSEHGRASRC